MHSLSLEILLSSTSSSTAPFTGIGFSWLLGEEDLGMRKKKNKKNCDWWLMDMKKSFNNICFMYPNVKYKYSLHKLFQKNKQKQAKTPPFQFLFLNKQAKTSKNTILFNFFFSPNKPRLSPS
jgi:hypothetical protein